MEQHWSPLSTQTLTFPFERMSRQDQAGLSGKEARWLAEIETSLEVRYGWDFVEIELLGLVELRYTAKIRQRETLALTGDVFTSSNNQYPTLTYQRFSRFAWLFKGKSEVLRFDLDGLFSVLPTFISLACRKVRITVHPINLFFSFGPTFLRSLPLFLFSGRAWEMIFNFSSTLFPWSNMVIFTSAMVDSTLKDSTFLLMLFWTTKEEEAVGKIFGSEHHLAATFRIMFEKLYPGGI